MLGAFAGQTWWFRRHKPLISIGVVWFGALGMLAIGWFFAERAAQHRAIELATMMEGYARVYASETERMGHAQIPTRGASEHPAFRPIIEAQQRWLALTAAVHDIYTVRKLPGGTNVFIADSATDYDGNGRIEGDRESATAPGEKFDSADPGLERAFAGETNFEIEPITDRWGTWVGAFVPLRDAQGRVEAVLGVDFDATQFQAILANARLNVTAVLAILEMGLLAASTVVLLLQNQMAERKRAADAIAEREERFRVFMEHCPAVAYLKDAEGRYVYVNRLFHERFGSGNELADVAENEPDRPLVETIVPGGGGAAPTHWLRYRFGCTDGSGRPMLGGFAVDVTEQIEMEAQLRHAQKMESVGLLAAGVAHDFNNTLGIITGYAGALREGASPAEVSEFAARIESAAASGAELVQHLLAFSRKKVLSMAVIDPNELVHELAEVLRRTFPAEIAISVRHGRDLPCMNADSALIKQVLMSLALNARDAMPEGGELKITTSVREASEADARRAGVAARGAFVRIGIRDNGCGMDAVTLSRAFEPFFTTKDAATRSGLGLSTAEGIVNQHGGWIEAASRPGAGAEFRIHLPAVSRPANKRGFSPNANKAQQWEQRETILLVEDNDGVRAMERILLTRNGYQVIEAASGPEALQVWDAHSDEISLLLTDMIMPDGMNGRDLAARLKEERPDLKVIYASGYSPQFVDSRFGLQPDEVLLEKPFAPEVLSRTVREALDGLNPSIGPEEGYEPELLISK
jgi:signal transduction histidine kinase